MSRASRAAADPLSRRDLLRAGALAAGGTLCDLGTSRASPPAHGRAKSCIVLCLVGGPSQLETWDPKPDAPAEVRGPFRSIATRVPGLRISEHLPRLAGLAHHYTLLRTLHHTAAPVHETGWQLLQTGQRCTLATELPHFGAVLAQQRGTPFVVLPSRLGNLGIPVSHGQGAGRLGPAHEPRVLTDFHRRLDPCDRARYGKTPLGDACLQARLLVEEGPCCAVVNMFDTVYDRVTWDCHAGRHGLTSTLDDYRRSLCPALDGAGAALLEDLHQRGLLEETLVLMLGEMGRTPRLNAQGGRDHWTGCWSILMAGGGVRGGQVIGQSDRHAAEPARRPVSCAELAGGVYNALGLAPPEDRIPAVARTR